MLTHIFDFCGDFWWSLYKIERCGAVPFKGVWVMATNVKLSDELVQQAGRIAAIEHRSVPKQIEFYFKIAAIAEANPELSFKLIKEILKSDAEAAVGHYKFG